MTGTPPLEVALYFVAGGALGAVYFLLLARSVDLHAAQAGALRVLPLYVLRLALAVGTFWLVARQGALPLLVALLGFIVARYAIQRRYGT